jgi:hypothetical protein
MLKGLMFLSEAPSTSNTAAGDQIDLSTNGTEPMEDDAGVKSDANSDTTSSADSSKDNQDIDLTTDSPSAVEDDSTDDFSDDSEDQVDDVPAEEEEDVTPSSDATAKKFRLLKEYERLYSVTEDLKESLSRIDRSEMTDTEKAMFLELDRTLTDSLEKFEYVMGTAYQALEYEKLLTVYMYLKSTVNFVSGLLQNLSQLKKQ